MGRKRRYSGESSGDSGGENRRKSSKKSKKEKKRKREKSRRDRSRSPRAEEPPVPDSRLEEGEYVDDNGDTDREGGATPEPADPVESGAGAESLSIEETNKLRLKIGLPPLKVGNEIPETEEPEDGDPADGVLIPGSDGVRHKPAENISEQSHALKIREKLELRRQKRKQESKLLTVKTLADSDSEDDAKDWVKRQKRKQKEMEMAKKRAKMLEDMDDEFGVDNIVKQEVSKEKSYNVNHLKGLKVEHSANRFQEGKSIILTLKDNDILDEEAKDTLVNVNFVDDEKLEKNLDNIKKSRIGYNKYDQEDVNEFGELEKKQMLDKYDEEIDGVKKDSFTIGHKGQFSQAEEVEKRKKEIREKLANKSAISLNYDSFKVASDYMTKEEAETKFKKPKKKSKKAKRRVLKADDLLGLEEDTTALGSRQSSSIPELEQEDAMVLKGLKKAKKGRKVVEDVADQILEVLPEPETEVATSSGAEFIGTFSDEVKANIVLNETSEFCRHLGAWQASESKGKPEPPAVAREILDFEESLKRPETLERERGLQGRWEAVEEDEKEEKEVFRSLIEKGEKEKHGAVLGEEPDLAKGVMAAIKLAKNKGYLETGEARSQSMNLKHLEAKNYSIDDKMGNSDDRGSRGRDRYQGPSQPFQEKAGYVPKVNLEYVDDSGRKMNEKEAFRYLSHKFHGKGSGKIKTEKRMKKILEDSMMRNMSSTDTPLNTLKKLRERQQESSTPYVILTGNKSQQDVTDLRK